MARHRLSSMSPTWFEGHWPRVSNDPQDAPDIEEDVLDGPIEWDESDVLEGIATCDLCGRPEDHLHNLDEWGFTAADEEDR